MRYLIYLYLFILINTFYPSHLVAKETWILDQNLSSINFELPVLLAKNVQGKFKEMNGIIEIDLENKKNNKAVFSVNLDSVEMNYKNFKSLLLGKIFFDTQNYPKAVVDTKKFSYDNENKITLKVELIIKGISSNVPLELEIIQLAKELVQIKGELIFSRNEFNIGTGRWASTTILKDNVKIKTNFFLYKS